MKHFCTYFGTTLLIAFALLLALATPAFAADLDFNRLVSGVERRYQVRHEHILLIGFASFCTRIYTHGGVKGLRIADFENSGTRISADDFDAYLHEQLGESWNVIVRSHERATNEDTIIYARANGKNFLLLIADVENGELSLVNVGINGDKLPKWVNDHEAHERRSN
jgi:hypothetical protein